MKLISCPMCSSSKINNRFKDDRFNYSINSCLECSLVFKTKSPQIIYEDLDLDSYTVYNFQRKKEVNEIINILKRVFIDIERISILEIGCGSGALLNEIRKYGINEVQGIEPSAVAANYAIDNFNLDVSSGYFKHNSFKRTFNVILLYDVLEHLINPRELFKEISRYMNKDTVLLVKTGDVNSINARVFPREWQYFKSPQHVCFYNKRSLENLSKYYNLKIEKFYSWKHAYGGFHLKKIFLNLIKGLTVRVLYTIKIFVNPVKNYDLALANDHFIALIKKEQ